MRVGGGGEDGSGGVEGGRGREGGPGREGAALCAVLAEAAHWAGPLSVVPPRPSHAAPVRAPSLFTGTMAASATSI